MPQQVPGLRAAAERQDVPAPAAMMIAARAVRKPAVPTETMVRDRGCLEMMPAVISETPEKASPAQDEHSERVAVLPASQELRRAVGLLQQACRAPG